MNPEFVVVAIGGLVFFTWALTWGHMKSKQDKALWDEADYWKRKIMQMRVEEKEGGEK